MKLTDKRLGPALTGLGVFLLYLAFPSNHHNFDGVACAIAVELADYKHLLHGNHLAYGFIGYLFHGALSLIGLKLSALWALQLLDSLLGAAGAGLFHHILARRGFPQRIASLSALGLALSFGYWMSALEAQVYMLGAFCLIALLGELLEDKPRVRRVALLHAAAMLAHGANALAAPAAAYALLRSRSGKPGRAAVLRYFLIAAAVVVAAYLAAGILFVKPTDLQELKIWLGGSAMLNPDREFVWHGGAFWANNFNWLRYSLKVVSPAYVLGSAVWAAAFWTLWKKRTQERALVHTAVLWIVPFALFFSRWESMTLHFRVNDLIPLWLLAAVAIKSASRRRFALPACGLFIALLAAGNLGGGILALSDASTNRALQEAKWIKANTPQNAWVAAHGIEEVYVPYFAHRKPLILRFTGAGAALTGRIWNILSAGDPVFVTSRRLDESDAFPPGLALRVVSRRGSVVLYEITAIAQ